MNPTIRNALIFILALIMVNELHVMHFNQIRLRDWHIIATLEFSTFYLEHLTVFLFLAIPELVAGFLMAKLLVGKFKILWCLTATVALTYYFKPIFWQVEDVSLSEAIIMYSAYYLHPISLVIFAFLLLKWPNPKLKRDS